MSDASTYIQGLIDSASNGDTIGLDNNSYDLISSPIIFPQEKSLTIRSNQGNRRGVIINSKLGGIPAFQYARTASKAGCIIEFRDITGTLDGLGKTAGSKFISSYGYADGQDDNYLRVFNCEAAGFDNIIEAKWTGQSKIADCDFNGNNLSFNLLRGASQWKLTDINSFDEKFIVGYDPAADGYTNGLEIYDSNNEGATGENINLTGWQEVNVISAGYDSGSGGSRALIFNACQDVNLDDLYVSGTPGTTARDGVVFNQSVRCSLRNSRVVNCNIGARIYGVSGVATDSDILHNNFDGNAINDVVLQAYSTGCEIAYNRHKKQMSRTGSNYEIYANTVGADYNYIHDNKHHGSSYPITSGINSVIGTNYFSQPA